MSLNLRVRMVVGEDDGRRYVLSCLEGDDRFGKPAERFLTCDRILADEIVEIALAPATPQPADGAASSAPEVEMVDCPACEGRGYRRNECDACEGAGEMPAEYADEWVRNHQDAREATDDQRLHARLERDGPLTAAAGGAS